MVKIFVRAAWLGLALHVALHLLQDVDDWLEIRAAETIIEKQRLDLDRSYFDMQYPPVKEKNSA